MDDQEYGDMSMDARLIAEEKMRRRDREKARREGRLPAAFMDAGLYLDYLFLIICSFLIYITLDDDELDRPIRARRRHRDANADMDLEDADDVRITSIALWNVLHNHAYFIYIYIYI